MIDTKIPKIESKKKPTAKKKPATPRKVVLPEVVEELQYCLEGDGAVFEQLSDGAAGFDLATTEAVRLYPGKSKVVETGVRVAIPKGNVGLLFPKSSLKGKFGFEQITGVIDSDYRGIIKCNVKNSEPKYLKKLTPGDLISQLVVVKLTDLTVKQVESLSETKRGSAGFGEMTKAVGKA